METKLPEINFSYNWNKKLDCNAFTTIRLANSEKYVIGRSYQLNLNKEKHSIATIAAINRFQLDRLSEFIARIDTGYDVENCRNVILKMYKQVDFSTAFMYLILLVKEK